MIVDTWTSEQWATFTISFAAITTGGLLLLALARHLMSATPAPIGPPPPRHPTGAELAAFRRNWIAAHNAPVRVLTAETAVVHDCNTHEPYSHRWDRPVSGEFTVVGDDLDTDTAAHLLPGAGSVTTLAGIADDPELISERQQRTREERWVHHYDADATAVIDWFERAASGALDTAIAALLEGVSGADRLDLWRIDTPTGEWPVVLPTRGALAEALLVS